MVLKRRRIKRVVITGSPGAGKTSIINGLKNLGYSIFEEYSRSLIENAQKDNKSNFFLEDPLKFSEELMKERKKQFENAYRLNKTKKNIIFYDRGIHDVFAYLLTIGKGNAYWKKKVLKFQYDLVFLVAPWRKIYVRDNQRLETFKVAQSYYPYIKKTYSMKHDVIEIPQMTIGERVAFVESYLSMHE